MGRLDVLINRHGLASLLRLPRPVARRLFGDPPRNDQGAQMDFQTHLFCRLSNMVMRRDLSELGIDRAREVYGDAVIALSPRPAPIPVVEDHRVVTRAGSLLGRLYKPTKATPLPVCMYLHGGGYCVGDVASYDALARVIARAANCAVFSVDYRLAPEHPFPAAVDDGVDAFAWLQQHARELGLDADRIAIAGDSAGANLALVIAQHQIESDGPRPSKLFALYPGTWQAHALPSLELFAEGFFLTAQSITWFRDTFAGRHDEPDDPRLSPIQFERMAEMPPVYLATAGFDPLRDEGDRYGDKLQAAGVSVTQQRFDELIHGYVTLGRVLDGARRATDEFLSQLRSWAR